MSRHSHSSVEFIYGIHAVKALLRFAPERVLQLYALKGRDDKKLQPIIALAQKESINIQQLSRQQLDAMQANRVHQGVVAEIKPAKALQESDLADIIQSTDSPFLLVLDNIQDPHNLGACLRTAEAVGAHAVIAPRDKAVGLSSTVRKVASGAAELVPFIQVTNLSRALRKMQELGVWVIGAAGEAKDSIYAVNLNQPVALVLGAEGTGLRRLTTEYCDKLVNIPMFGRLESLNVSVAAGVFLYEAVRQRQLSKI